MKKTYIFGHKNPDTDSVTSAIALSYLKNRLGMDTEPRILSEINKETEFVLKFFGIKKPEILEDVKVQLKDIPYRRDLMVVDDASIYEAYNLMVENGVTGLPVVKRDKKFIGYASLKEIATDLIKGDFDTLNTSYDNILKVIDGTSILKFDDEIKGDIIAATYSSELFISNVNIDKSKILIVGNRKHVIDYTINNLAKLIIVVGGETLNDYQLETAKKNEVNIISTEKNSFEVAKLIGLSNYATNIMRQETTTTFNPNDYLTDFYEVSNKERHTNYPIVDSKNRCVGLLRLTDLNSYDRKEVILVDHNDAKQSVTGLNEAKIIEIIDHHAIGNVTTNAPISFRNMIVGSTNTIVYHLFKEAHIDIPKEIAGIMLSGILSDTLILKSPTTTDIDRYVVEELAKIAGLDYEKYGMEMLKAGSSLDDLTVDQIVFYDYKEFETEKSKFGVGQILTLDYEKILVKKEAFIEYLNKSCELKGFKFMALFITDIINEGSYVIYSTNGEQILSNAFNMEVKEGTYIDGIISRKKQIIPCIMDEFDSIE